MITHAPTHMRAFKFKIVEENQLDLIKLRNLIVKMDTQVDQRIKYG